MGKTLAVIFVAAVTLALCCEAVSAKTVPHPHRYRHERSHRRFQYLRDLIDRLDLRQKTDHILITNLQKTLKEVQERGAWNLRVLADFEREKVNHEVNLQKALKKEEERGVWPSRTQADFVKEKDGRLNHEVSLQNALKTSKQLADFERDKSKIESYEVNLQNALKDAEERSAGTSRAPADFEEKNGKRQVQERQKENIEVNDQERRDEILLLRQELAALRSEVRVLKEERAVEFQHRSAHSIQQEHREALTASWVVENIRRLQDAVVGLQEAMNVTTALHDKQEVESRLLVVGRDLGALRSSLSSVTSKVEAAMATVETVREELVRTSEDSNHARGRVEALGLEVSGIREEFNNLLSVLPEGLTVRGLNAATKDSNPSSSEAAVDEEGTIASHPPLQKAKNTMQPVRDDLDSSATQLEHKTSGRPSVSATRKENRQLEERVKATESGLGEVRASSIQLLDALETLEAQVEIGIAEVRQEVAKLEYKMTNIQDSAKISEVPTNKSDIQALTKRINQLEFKMSVIQESAKNSGVTNSGSYIQTLKNRID